MTNANVKVIHFNQTPVYWRYQPLHVQEVRRRSKWISTSLSENSMP